MASSQAHNHGGGQEEPQHTSGAPSKWRGGGGLGMNRLFSPKAILLGGRAAPGGAAQPPAFAPKTILLVLLDGSVRIYTQPITVAQVVNEFPRCNVGSSKSMRCQLAPDKKLHLGSTYYLTRREDTDPARLADGGSPWRGCGSHCAAAGGTNSRGGSRPLTPQQEAVVGFSAASHSSTPSPFFWDMLRPSHSSSHALGPTSHSPILPGPIMRHFSPDSVRMCHMSHHHSPDPPHMSHMSLHHSPDVLGMSHMSHHHYSPDALSSAHSQSPDARCPSHYSPDAVAVRGKYSQRYPLDWLDPPPPPPPLHPAHHLATDSMHRAAFRAPGRVRRASSVPRQVIISAVAEAASEASWEASAAEEGSQQCVTSGRWVGIDEDKEQSEFGLSLQVPAPHPAHPPTHVLTLTNPEPEPEPDVAPFRRTRSGDRSPRAAIAPSLLRLWSGRFQEAPGSGEGQLVRNGRFGLGSSSDSHGRGGKGVGAGSRGCFPSHKSRDGTPEGTSKGVADAPKRASFELVIDSAASRLFPLKINDPSAHMSRSRSVHYEQGDPFSPRQDVRIAVATSTARKPTARGGMQRWRPAVRPVRTISSGVLSPSMDEFPNPKTLGGMKAPSGISFLALPASSSLKSECSSSSFSPTTPGPAMSFSSCSSCNHSPGLMGAHTPFSPSAATPPLAASPSATHDSPCWTPSPPANHSPTGFLENAVGTPGAVGFGLFREPRPSSRFRKNRTEA